MHLILKIFIIKQVQIFLFNPKTEEKPCARDLGPCTNEALFFAYKFLGELA